MSSYDWFALSERGPDMDANQDVVLADPETGIFVVADGMGGRPGGAEASRVAAESFLEQVRHLEVSLRTDDYMLRSAVDVVNKKVRSIADTNPLLSGLGTTLSAVILDGTRGKIVHIGDSRVYLFRGNKLEQLTKDHTLVAELMERKHLSVEGARRYPLRHVLSRSLGTRETVEPDINDVALSPNDWLILATDGVTKAFDPDRLCEIVRSEDGGNAEDICRQIMAAVMRQSPDDNATVAVVKLTA